MPLTTMLQLPDDLYCWLEDEAERQGVPLTALMQQVLTDYQTVCYYRWKLHEVVEKRNGTEIDVNQHLNGIAQKTPVTRAATRDDTPEYVPVPRRKPRITHLGVNVARKVAQKKRRRRR